MINKLHKQLREIEYLGNNWHDDNIPGPTVEVLNLGQRLVPDLAKTFDGTIHVTQTVEEGLCFIFKKSMYKLYLELYNDGDICYISTNEIKKEMIKCQCINENEIISVISKFNKIC